MKWKTEYYYAIIAALFLAGLAVWYFFFRAKNGALALAQKAVGIKEIGENAGYSDATFQTEMNKLGGWGKGAPWCASFVRYAFLKAYQGKPQYETLKKILVPSAVQTYNNAKKHPELFTISEKPKAGDIVIWQNHSGGSPQSTGHAGMVESVNANGSYNSIEGNTSISKGIQGVSRKKRALDDYKINNGLRLKGFLRIK